MRGVRYEVQVVPGTTTTLATAIAANGFTLAIGMTACADPANFNAELGAKYAIKDAKAKARQELWKLEGWRLKCHLEEMSGPRVGVQQITSDEMARLIEMPCGIIHNNSPSVGQCSIDEERDNGTTELAECISKLERFHGGKLFSSITDEALKERSRKALGDLKSQISGGTGSPKPSHIERMRMEQQQLAERTRKLEEFIALTPMEALKQLPQQERNRMKRQLVAMREYLAALNERIAAATNP